MKHRRQPLMGHSPIVCQRQGCSSAKAPVWRPTIFLEVPGSRRIVPLVIALRLCDDCRDRIQVVEFMTAETWELVDQLWKCRFDRAGGRLGFDLVDLDEDLMDGLPILRTG